MCSCRDIEVKKQVYQVVYFESLLYDDYSYCIVWCNVNGEWYEW